MHLLLKILRRIGLAIVIVIYTLMLQMALFFVPVSLTLQDESTVKGWLSETGAYARFTDLVSDQLASPDRPDAEIGLKPEDLQKILDEVLPPDVLQGYGDEIIGGYYAWLRGETPEPQFRVDVTERRPQIEASIRGLIIERLSGAPVCSPAPAPEDYDPFSDGCLLPGRSAESTADLSSKALFEGEGGLNDLVLDSEKIYANTDFTDHPLPKLYKTLGPLRIALFAAMVISGTVAVFLAEHWRKGLRRLSWITLTVCAFALAGTILLTKLLPGAVNRMTLESAEQDVNVAGVIVPVFNAALSDIGRGIIIFAGILFAPSIGTLIWLWRTKPEDQKKSSKPDFRSEDHPSTG